MLRLIIRLAILINRQKFLVVLSKLEFGVSIFCQKLSRLAFNEGKEDLAFSLEHHAIEERCHGKMLASLAGSRTKLTENGRWISLFKNENRIVDYPPDVFVDSPQTVSVYGELPSGNKISGLFENFDGISNRYAAMRFLLSNKSFDSLPWEDRLALMYCLEEQTKSFYLEVSRCGDSDLVAVANIIYSQEGDHAQYLKNDLSVFTEVPKKLINKWNRRILVSKLFLIFDLFDFCFYA